MRALYFANAHHSVELSTSQRVLLGYLCVREAGKYDPRVGGAVEVALLRENKPVKFFSQEEVAEVERESTYRRVPLFLSDHFR